MSFTSTSFVLFLLAVFFLYWFVFNHDLKLQNVFLLASSYFFYGMWDWRFLLLLFMLSIVNYLIVLGMQWKLAKVWVRFLFLAGLAINIGVLLVFKYSDFIVAGITHLASLFGAKTNLQVPIIIQPLGISFYIFLSISYIIDAHQRKLTHTGTVFEALLSFSFFPIILAGPLQRPISLLPQIQSTRTFSYLQAADGLKQILWGAFMKIVIADNCGATVSTIFAHPSIYSGSTLVLGIALFTVQIYADFAGYSNMAIGIGKLLGFTIAKNFAFPYFARDIREFWQRWNISLTTWFRDYVFLPIAYSASRKIKQGRLCLVKSEFLIYAAGISVTWLLTGLWHGANFTFMIWGLIHGFFLLSHHATATPRKKLLKQLHVRNDARLLKFVDSLTLLAVVMFSWIFFKAETVNHALAYISGMFSLSLFSLPLFFQKFKILLIALFFFIEWLGRSQEYAIAQFGCKWPKPARWIFYYAIILSILWFAGNGQQFIYFSF